MTGVAATVLCVHEDWNGGAGNGLGTLYAFQKACAKGMAKGVDVAKQIQRTIPRKQTLAAGEGFHYSVYLRRKVYSLYFAHKRGGEEAMEEAIDFPEISALFALNAGSRSLLRSKCP